MKFIHIGKIHVLDLWNICSRNLSLATSENTDNQYFGFWDHKNGINQILKLKKQNDLDF